MPYMMKAPISTAVEPEPGTPSVSSGTIEPQVAALLAASGPATPSIMPVPNFSGVFEMRFSTVYDSMVAMVAPAPGNTPLKNPIRPPRRIGMIERPHSSRVNHRRPLSLMISALPLM